MTPTSEPSIVVATDGASPSARGVRSRALSILGWAALSLIANVVATSAIDLRQLNGEFMDAIVQDEFKFALFVVVAILIAPAFETAVMLVEVAFLRRFTSHHLLIVLAIAAMAAYVHEDNFRGAGISVFLPFVIYAHVLIAHGRTSRMTGYVDATTIHALCNLVVFLPTLF